jgi:hypothetical protein
MGVFGLDRARGLNFMVRTVIAELLPEAMQ